MQITTERAERLRIAREKRWSDPQQRQRLAERNRARSKHAHPATSAQKITIAPSPAKVVESAHVAKVQFLSEMRVGMMSDTELENALRERQAGSTRTDAEADT